MLGLRNEAVARTRVDVGGHVEIARRARRESRPGSGPRRRRRASPCRSRPESFRVTAGRRSTGGVAAWHPGRERQRHGHRRRAIRGRNPVHGISLAQRCARGSSARALDERRDLVGTERAREQVALPQARAQRPQLVELARLLDALGDRFESQAPGRARRSTAPARPHPGPRRRRRRTTVDLEDVDGQPAQVAQRRVAGAEVVDREPDAEVSEPLQRADRRSTSCIRTLSVISSVRQLGRAARLAQAPRATSSTSPGSSTCRPDRLTLIVEAGRPARRAAMRCACGTPARGPSGRSARSARSPRRSG